MKACRKLVAGALLASIFTSVQPAQADVRIKDITTIEGVRTNKLTGMGLVTGLDGTGGRSPVTREFALNMLQRFGLRADPLQRLAIRNDARQRTDNLSVVTVTAELPIFAKRGSQIGVMVSAFDDAESLQGGVLINTPLFGVDNQVYALASGPVSVGGFSFEGQAASVQKNHPTTGRSQAVVEQEVPFVYGQLDCIHLLIRQPDFETARRISDAINHVISGSAITLDAGTVKVQVPPSRRFDPAGFTAMVQSLRVDPDIDAKVIVNERTGTVVVGENVRLAKVAITHANLSVVTGESPEVAQPAPFSRGRTTVVPRTELDVVEEKEPITVLDEPATVGDLARALNALGVTPRDLSAIFQMLRESGALHAELELK